MTNCLQQQNHFKVILMEWKDCGEFFLNGFKFASKPNHLQIHIFINKSDETEQDTIQSVRLSLKNIAVFHASLTNNLEAPWTDLLAYLINFYARMNFSCHHCTTMFHHKQYQQSSATQNNTLPPSAGYHVILAARNQDKYEELKALLKTTNNNKNNRSQQIITIRMVDGWQSTLLDLFPHVCTECGIIFNDPKQVIAHEKNDHSNYLCKNSACVRSRRGNGFYSNRELERHVQKQLQCKFCSEERFCEADKYKEHMRICHVFCDCSCETYFNTVKEYFEHYGEVSPLPCLEVQGCEMRFKNIDEQAFHHKHIHGSR